MTEYVDDPFATSSGLPDDFAGVIMSAEYKYHDEWTDTNSEGVATPQVGLLVHLQSDDLETGEYDLWVKTGTGWEPGENGAVIVRNDGKKAQFHDNAGMGQLVKAVVGTEAPVREKFEATGLGPLDAAFWEGWEFRWERKHYESTINGEKASWDRLLPMEYIGQVSTNGSGPAKAAAPVAKAATKKAAPKKGKGDDREKLFAIAYDAENHDAYLEAAYAAFPDGGPEVQEMIDDETADGVWEQAVAKWNADHAS